MAKKISELAAVTDVQDTDEFVVARSGATNSITGAHLKAAVTNPITTPVQISPTDTANPSLAVDAPDGVNAIAYFANSLDNGLTVRPDGHVFIEAATTGDTAALTVEQDSTGTILACRGPVNSPLVVEANAIVFATASIPTSDPHVAGQIYSLAGVLHISAG